MFNGYKVVVWTPAGRKRYMELLARHVLSCELVDEYRICVNTTNQDDISWFESMKKKHSRVSIERHPPNASKPGSDAHAGETIGWFFRNTMDEGTIYIRLDDDIVWLEDDFFTKLLESRIRNKDYLFILPGIINNAIVDHIHWRMGLYPLPTGQIMGYECESEWGHKNGKFCEEKHRRFLGAINEGSTDKYKFGLWVLYHSERISINCLCYFGGCFDGIVPSCEEPYLTMDLPGKVNKFHCIDGGVLCSHFAFYTQRGHMDGTDVLEKYKEHAPNERSH